MEIHRLTAHGEHPIDLNQLETWRAARRPTTPFSEPAMALCGALSRALFADPEAKARPDLIALAYWLRPGPLAGMARAFTAGLPPDCLAVPRGVALHFPPTNVDTVMAYTWALSTLAGNRSLIRVSERLGESGRRLLALMIGALETSPLADHTLFLRYGRDDAVTAALSALADLRVMWGGDASVARLRAIPAPPRCRDTLFPDRRSLAALSLATWQAADSPERERLVEAFLVDALTFDQMACSSPRLLAWVGAGDAVAASADFFARLSAAAERRDISIPVGQALAKRALAAGAALDGHATRWRDFGPVATVLDWPDPTTELEGWSGGGLFLQTTVARLADLAAVCDARTQTLTAHGFAPEEVAALVASAAERAPDRVVPFGRALAFASVWDGLDLLREFTRLVHRPAS